MKILIIGGTGFIGTYLTRLLVQYGHQVAIFHRKNAMVDPGLRVIEFPGDRQDIFNFRKDFLSFKPDRVVDTIAYTAQDVWSLQAALKDVTDKLIMLSSGDVYEAYDTFHRNLSKIENSPLLETSPLRSRLYPYRPADNDQFNELLFNYDKILVEKLAQAEILNTIILRLPAVFGPGDKQGKLSEYIKPLITNQPTISLSSKKANWIWTRSYVENVAHGICLAATSDIAGNGIFNLGDINLMEIDLVRKLKELTGWVGDVILDSEIQEPYNYSQNIQMDNSKFKKQFNYVEIVDVESALLSTIESCKARL